MRSNARPTCSASAKQRDFYIAIPSSPIKPGPTINWRQMKADMQMRIKMHSDGKEAYKRMWPFSLSQPSIPSDDVIDRPILADNTTRSPNISRMQWTVLPSSHITKHIQSSYH
jgi:hypothetical protein